MGARHLLEARTCTLLAILAVLVTVSLRIPSFGVWGAAVSLAMVMVGYGELLRRGSQGDWAPRSHVSPMDRGWRVFLCLAAAVGLALPLIVAWGNQEGPRVTRAGLLIAGGLCLVVPLAMLGTYAAEGSVKERLRLVLLMIRRHPLATVCSLLVVPLSLIAVEFSLFGMTNCAGVFSLFELDLFPLPPGVRLIGGRAEFGTTDFQSIPFGTYLACYYRALTQGYTFTGSIAASLALPITNGIDPRRLFARASDYLWLRMFFTLFTVTCMLAALAVQARWLGLLLTMDSRRTAAEAAICSATSGTAAQLVVTREQGLPA